MRRHASEYGLFLQEFLRNFRTTGAVAPSGRFLAAALARYVAGADRPRRILEVGPGTGAVTGRIVRDLGPDDLLDLVEVNERFVRQLRNRFQNESPFREVAPRAQILHCLIQDLTPGATYDLIVSGLPLNNFAVADVQQILGCLMGLLRPGGILSFFEYIAIRSARALMSGPAERARLRGSGQAINGLLGQHEFRREWIWPNLPPAWVHHVRAQ